MNSSCSGFKDTVLVREVLIQLLIVEVLLSGGVDWIDLYRMMYLKCW